MKCKFCGTEKADGSPLCPNPNCKSNRLPRVDKKPKESGGKPQKLYD